MIQLLCSISIQVKLIKLDRSRGFGFITFQERSAAETVIKNQPHAIDGKAVECKMAIPKDNMPENVKHEEINQQVSHTRKIFVGGLPQQLKESEMKIYFERFGEIEQCVIMKDKPSGRSRGFGFVVFVKEESADAVMVDKTNHNIMGKWVETF